MPSAAAIAEQPALQLSDFQARVCAVPESYDAFMGGGRGGSKSFALAILALRHLEQYGSKARVLYVRKTHKALADFETITRDVFGTVYGRGARYNANEGIWRVPGGGYFELNQLQDPGDYAKYQGRSFTLLLTDEAGQYATPELLDKLRSNLRGPRGMPIRMVMAANPGDAGHSWLSSRYVFNAAPWSPFYEPHSKREWISCPSTYLDNPFIDPDEYVAQLEASCAADPELLKAWLSGDWAIARGSFFGSVLEEGRNAIDPWSPEFFGAEQAKDQSAEMRRQRRLFPGYFQNDWRLHLAHDYGSAAPSVTFVLATSPGMNGPDGRFYPRDSIIVLDELATNAPGSVDRGMGYTIPHLCDQIAELAERWGIRPLGVADDACFSKHGHSAGSIADEMRHHGVYFSEAKKGDRKTGWEIVRRLMADAGKTDRPGLYISRACSYFWQTVPYLPRDPRRLEDLDSRSADHGADALRYGVLYQRPAGGQHKVMGFF